MDGVSWRGREQAAWCYITWLNEGCAWRQKPVLKKERKRGEYEDEGKKEREEMVEGRREGKKEGRRERTERKKW